MLTETARFETANAGKYLVQMCKHFAHKVSVERTGAEARVALPPGLAAMQADESGLTFWISAADPAGLDRARHIITDHITRFAFRENFGGLDWRESEAGAYPSGYIGID